MLETFLILGIAFLAIQIWTIFNPTAYLFFMDESKKIAKAMRNNDYQGLEELSEDDKFYLKEGLKLNLSKLLFTLWGIIGLFTPLNIFFIPVILMSGVNSVGMKVIKSDNGLIIFTVIDNLLSVAIILAIISFYFGPMIIV